MLRVCQTGESFLVHQLREGVDGEDGGVPLLPGGGPLRPALVLLLLPVFSCRGGNRGDSFLVSAACRVAARVQGGGQGGGQGPPVDVQRGQPLLSATLVLGLRGHSQPPQQREEMSSALSPSSLRSGLVSLLQTFTETFRVTCGHGPN